MNMNFDFNNPTKILFGSGKLNELGSQPLPGKKALLLMSGGKSAKVSGAYDRTLEQLRKAGVEVTEFAKVMENPVKETVMEGAAFAKENGCDFIVALGGGAVLDASTAISAMARRSGMYSGRHPAMTPFTATFQTFSVPMAGSKTPSTSSGSRSVNARNFSIRSMVGGVTGRPSPHCLSAKNSCTSSYPPSNTISRSPGPFFLAFTVLFTGIVSAFKIPGTTVSLMFFFMVSSSSRAMAAGYSTTRMSG